MGRSSKSREVFVLLHNMRSLQNVGSVFRTSDVFGVSKIYITGYTGKPPNEKISKTALGAENYVPWEYMASPARLITKLRKQYPGLQVLGLENKLPKSLQKKVSVLPAVVRPSSGQLLLVLGEELTGIPKNLLKLCDGFLEIPQVGQKESLNVAVAFGVAAYALRFGV